MQLEEVINYKEYLDFMESKKVRQGIRNVSFLDPTPKDIQKHFDFIDITYNFLKQKYPKDIYLQSLKNEAMLVEYCSMNWYKRYGVEKKY